MLWIEITPKAACTPHCDRKRATSSPTLICCGVTVFAVVADVAAAARRVVWMTEFGRMPTFQKGACGRDHNPNGFTTWMTGAGVKKGFSYGATDELGHKAVENVTNIYDLHATILDLMGLDHERLSYYHNGIERRLTDVHGHVVKAVLA